MHDETNPIAAVRARLDNGRKWHKGSFSDDGGEKVCLLGALDDVLVGSEQRMETLDVLRRTIVEQYRDRLTSEQLMRGLVVAPFNDHPATEFSDIEVVLDKAAVQ
jgi:hypothetical protein